MDLAEFLLQTQLDIKAETGERLEVRGDVFPFPESIFSEIIMQHMSDIGMTFEPVVCHYTAMVGNAKLKLSGYSVSDEADQLDLFVSLYSGVDNITPIPDAETKVAAEQCLRFFSKSVEGRLASTMDETNDAYPLVLTIQDCYPTLDQIRIYVLTDRVAKAKNFKPREVAGKTVKLEVMDIERLFRHWSAGKPRDELVINFDQVSGGALPCIYVPGDTSDYDYAMTVIPGEALRFIYEKYGPRLLEANVRSFLSAAGKVNKGIRETLQNTPERFMAYNNGIVLVADELHLGKTNEGGEGILWIKGMQIVNGGQTTASIYFSKKKNPGISLKNVRIPAKIIILKTEDAANEETLVADISKFANSQNAVRLSDLSANKPFHVEMEKLAMATYCPDGVGRWFYERAAGSYNVMLAREGTTPVRLASLKASIPSSRKITKTDLAKYINAWDQKPYLVSMGSQKNFERFMDSLKEDMSQESVKSLPDTIKYKEIIAKAIVYKSIQKLSRQEFTAFQANITAYTVSIFSYMLGNKIDFNKIWTNQNISAELEQQLLIWAKEIHEQLHKTANGRMISEWAKKPDCWDIILKADYTPANLSIPEIR